MNTPSSALSEAVGSQAVAPVTTSATQPFFWSVRRELLENRWLYLVPLGVAGVILFGTTITTVYLPARMRSLASDPMQRWKTVATHYNIAAAVLMGTLILLSIFYSAEALHGERRDRSILFWKSLPVSDLTTVLAKASIPLFVLPLLTVAITVALQWMMLLVSSLVLLANGMSVGPLWRELSIFQMWGMLFYHILTAHAIWPFPVYCWLMLVSGWARRATLLCAAVPVIAIGIIEKLVFHTSHFAAIVGARLIGASAPGSMTPGDGFPGPMTHLMPGAFLTAPGLWIGFIVAAIFLAAAARLRRYEGPI